MAWMSSTNKDRLSSKDLQASNKTKGSVERLGLSFYLLFVGERSLLESHWLTFGWAFLRL